VRTAADRETPELDPGRDQGPIELGDVTGDAGGTRSHGADIEGDAQSVYSSRPLG
jgi:hypothetical protein